jgi:hypothetical protein
LLYHWQQGVNLILLKGEYMNESKSHAILIAKLVDAQKKLRVIKKKEEECPGSLTLKEIKENLSLEFEVASIVDRLKSLRPA